MLVLFLDFYHSKTYYLSMQPKPSSLNMPEAKLLLDILNNRRSLQLVGINLDKLITLARLHNLEPIVFYRLSRITGSRFAGKDYTEHIPGHIYSYLRAEYIGNIRRNIKFWNEFLKINTAFRENNLSLLPLKGIDTLIRFYPYFDLRSMCDIDILIKEEEFLQVETVLSDLGYKKTLYGLRQEYWRKEQCHIAFYKDKTMVEAHWGLDFKRANRIILPHLWERTIQVEAGNHKISIFSPEDAFFSFTLHWRRFGNILSLKQVLDVARIIKESPRFDWDYVLKESGRGKMEAVIYFILMQVRLFFETEIPEDIFKKLNIPYWQKNLIKKFLFKYTFETQIPLKKLYLKAHFLLYDNLSEPILYLINIPPEQFCKFYSLKPYTNKANLLYRLRFIYMPISLIKNSLLSL